MQLILKIPEGMSLMYDTVQSSDESFAADKMKDGVVAVTQPEGELRFSARITAIGNYTVSANIAFNYNNSSWTQLIGTVNVKCPDITCCTLRKTSADTINVCGIASKGETVELYVDDVLAGEVVSSEYTGKYSTKLVLSAKESGSSYSVYAKCGDKISDKVDVIYEADLPSVKSVSMMYNGSIKKDITNIFESGVSPVINYNPHYPICFMVETDKTDQIYKVFVTSKKGDSIRKIEAYWDEEAQLYVTRDYFDPNNHSYVPGTLNIVIEPYETVEIKKGAPVVEFDYKPKEEVVANSYCEVVEQTDNSVLEKMVFSDGIDSVETYHYRSEADSVKVNGKETDAKDIAKDYQKYGFAKSGTKGVEDGRVYEYYVKPITGESINIDVTEVTSELLDQLDDYWGLWIVKVDDESGVATVVKEAWKNTMPEVASNVLEKVFGEEVAGLYGDVGTFISFGSSSASYFDSYLNAASAEERDAATALYMYDVMGLAATAMVSVAATPVAGMAFGFCVALVGDGLRKEVEAYFNGGGILRMIIDPSGMVYEAVPGNPVEGATVTIYYRDADTNEAVSWNAADYEQENPLITDDEGKYLWDVPEGYWKVVCEKEGYETAETDWMSIPPIRTDVNISLVSKETPVLVSAEKKGTGITVKLSKFVDIATVTADAFIVEGAKGELTVAPTLISDDDKYADTFIISGDFSSDITSVSVSEKVLSYAGVSAVKSSVSVTSIGLSLGDLNDDGKIDAKDASIVLTAYSKMSTGGDDGLTDSEREAANVNADDKIDAKDASYILGYYSLASTESNELPTMAEFMASKIA